MSRGLTDTIPKQSSSRHNGKPPGLLGQRKHGQSHVDCVFGCRWNCSSGVSSPGPENEQGILLGCHEEITRGCSQKRTGVVGVISLNASS
ncbi:hypothetical protein TNCV_2827111 [Trichonephila clavipes]|nr:hypothetical protein TNCV_2827111 [Trichonephila clavipes]